MTTYKSVDSYSKKALRTQQTLLFSVFCFVFCFVLFFLSVVVFFCSLMENHLDSHWLEVKHFHFYSLYVVNLYQNLREGLLLFNS